MKRAQIPTYIFILVIIYLCNPKAITHWKSWDIQSYNFCFIVRILKDYLFLILIDHVIICAKCKMVSLTCLWDIPKNVIGYFWNILSVWTKSVKCTAIRQWSKKTYLNIRISWFSAIHKTCSATDISIKIWNKYHLHEQKKKLIITILKYSMEIIVHVDIKWKTILIILKDMFFIL